MADGFSHLDETGAARMVDVGAKEVTARRAVAEATVTMSNDTRRRFFSGELPKGDALAVVRLAAINGAKQTPTLIPLAHPIGLDSVAVEVEEVADGARIIVTCTIAARTGVEMEAMTGAGVAALALYDMIKGLDRGAEVTGVRLLHKSGGKSGDWSR